MAREIGTVGVVGLGTMGAGIAEVLARSGLDVVAVEADPARVEHGRGLVERSTGRAVSRGKLSAEDQQALLGRIRFTASLEDLTAAQLVIEAVPERLDLKRELFGRLDAVVAPDAVLATNTSSLSVTSIASSTQHPGRVVGLHFFNPAPVQTFVEVVRTVVSERSVVDDVVALARRLGKQPVVVGDRAGFIANALLFGYLNHAIRMYEQRYVGREDLDAAMTLGAGLPMGPLALLDLIGLDTALQILETMYGETGDRLHAPAPLLRQLVVAGLLGRKSGRGFHSYQPPGSAPAASNGVRTSLEPARGREVSRVGFVVAPDAGLAAELADAGVDVVEDLADVDLVLASRSAVPVVEQAIGTPRPEDVVGFHVVGGVVEVVPSVVTSTDAVEAAVALAGRLDLRAVRCGDRAGFVVDALLFPYLNDAVRMVAEGYAGVDDVDTAMKAGCGYPAGPFELLDEVGLDVALATQRALYAESREPGHAPAPLLQQLVTAGRLGRATGHGFRTHP
jgi:3-hydroxybutyryl-CoA dehydrogenase